MPSFQIAISPSRRAAGRFIAQVRRKLRLALSEENEKSGLTQSEIARILNVDRSVISRELRGYGNISLGRVSELASAMGRTIQFELLDQADLYDSNIQQSGSWSSSNGVVSRPSQPGSTIEMEKIR